MLNHIFKALNLGQKETQVYLGLLERGSCTAGELSRQLQLPRSTLYSFLGTLLEQGLVSQSTRSGVKLWSAESPDTILELVNRRINDLEDVREKTVNILPELKMKVETDFIEPAFQYFEGAEAMRKLLDETLIYRDIDSFAIWPVQNMMEVVGERYLAEHNAQRIRQQIRIRSIWPETRVVDITEKTFLGTGKEFCREIRIGPAILDSTMGYWAFPDRVIFVASKRELFGFIVESRELVQLMKTQFEPLWQISKQLKIPLSQTKSFFDKWMS